jgi:hypothetical protein
MSESVLRHSYPSRVMTKPGDIQAKVRLETGKTKIRVRLEAVSIRSESDRTRPGSESGQTENRARSDRI